MNFIETHIFATIAIVAGLILIGVVTKRWLAKNFGGNQPANTTPPATTTTQTNTTTTSTPNQSRTGVLGAVKPLIGPLAVLIAVHFIIGQYAENVFEAWRTSFALMFLLGCLIAGTVLNYLGWITKGFWYYTLIIALPIICTIVHFVQNPVEGKDPEVTKDTPALTQPAEQVIHNLLEYDLTNGPVIVNIESTTRYEVTLERNSEVFIDGEKGNQTITTDSSGIRTLNPIRLDGNGRTRFSLIKGQAKLKTWELY